MSSVEDKNMEERVEASSWLLVIFDYGKSDLSDLVQYEEELESLINPSGLGDVDGHDVAVDLSDGEYWIACKDTLGVFSLIKESLFKTKLIRVREVKKRDAGEEGYSTIFKV